MVKCWPTGRASRPTCCWPPVSWYYEHHQRARLSNLVAIGHLIVPVDTDVEFLGRMHSVSGQIVTRQAPPRVFDGKDHFSAGFFELFDEPITLVLDGSFSFDEDVSPQLLRIAIAGIVLDGKIRASKRLVPMLQLLSIARDGKIESFDEPE